MQPLFLLWTAVGLASAQSIDLSSVRATPPVLVTPAVNVVAQTATYSPVPTFSTTESSDAAATTIALTPPQKRRRRQYLAERDGDCSPNPVPGYGPVPTPDTPDAFVEDQALQVCFLPFSPSLDRLWTDFSRQWPKKPRYRKDITLRSST